MSRYMFLCSAYEMEMYVAWSLVEGGRPGFWAMRERKPISLVSRQLDIMVTVVLKFSV